MLSTVGEVRINSEAMFSSGLLHMDSLVLPDEQKFTFISSVQMLDAVYMNIQKQWT